MWELCHVWFCACLKNLRRFEHDRSSDKICSLKAFKRKTCNLGAVSTRDDGKGQNSNFHFLLLNFIRTANDLGLGTDYSAFPAFLVDLTAWVLSCWLKIVTHFVWEAFMKFLECRFSLGKWLLQIGSCRIIRINILIFYSYLCFPNVALIFLLVGSSNLEPYTTRLH